MYWSVSVTEQKNTNKDTNNVLSIIFGEKIRKATYTNNVCIRTPLTWFSLIQGFYLASGCFDGSNSIVADYGTGTDKDSSTRDGFCLSYMSIFSMLLLFALDIDTYSLYRLHYANMPIQ